MAKNIVQRTIIQLGDREIDAYTMGEPSSTGGFVNYLSGAGMASAIGLARNSTLPGRMSKDLKALLPGGFATLQSSFRNDAGGRTKLSLWSTDAVVMFFRYHDRQGNESASALIDALLGTSLDIIINDALGRDYAKGFAAAATKLKYDRLTARHDWTDTIKDRMIQQGAYDPKSFETREFFKMLTKGMGYKPRPSRTAFSGF